MSFVVIGLPRLSSKESRTTILVAVMSIARLMIHVQQVEEDKLRDNTSRNEFG